MGWPQKKIEENESLFWGFSLLLVHLPHSSYSMCSWLEHEKKWLEEESHCEMDLRNY